MIKKKEHKKQYNFSFFFLFFQICISVPLNILTESEKLETQSKHINWKDSNFDLHNLVKLRKDYESNPIISYLNTNHLSSKIDCLGEIYNKSPIDILCIDEAKLDSSYQDAQFEIPGYQRPPYRKDRNKNGDGKIVFIREGLIIKRLKAFEVDISEMICLEVMIPQKVWFITYVYRPPCFHHTITFETSLSDCRKLILTFFKAYFKKLPPKNIEYRN